MEATPFISLAVVAHNAAAHLPALLSEIRAQTYPRDRFELLLIDSASADGTRGLMEAFAREAALLEPPLAASVLDNPGRILPCGCNVALDAYQGEALLRLDAHASIALDFLWNNVRALAEGHDIVGGYVAATPAASKREAPLVALDASRFAGGAAAFRNPGKARTVDTLAYPLVRREVYARVGRYDERLIRTEDNDMHYRMRQAGYRFRYDPAIVSRHRARGTLGGLLRQKWQNGRWVGLSLGVQARMFAPRHFVPMLFVLALAASLAVWALGFGWPLVALLAAYGVCDLLYTLLDSLASPVGRLRCLACLPWMFPLVHLCYGAGTLAGLFGASRVARGRDKKS